MAALTSASRAAATSASPRSSSGAVADRDDLDRHAVVVLDLGRGGLERARRALRVGRARRAAVEPRAQLALLAAGERGDLARVVGALLHQRERLQHRVVQVRGDLGALLRADPLGALGGQRRARAAATTARG